MEYLRAGCASLIGLVFVASVVSKLRDYGEFRMSLPALAPVSPGLLQPLAVFVIAAEAAVPVLLAIPSLTSSGFALSCGLLAAFSAAIAVALRRGRRAPCRCFGASGTPLGAGHLIRNFVLLIVAVTGGLVSWVHSPPAAGVAVAASAGLFAAILLVAFDDIVYLFAGSY